MTVARIPASVFVLFTVGVFSLYPAIMIVGAQETGPVTFVLLSQFFAALAGLLATAVFAARKSLGGALIRAAKALEAEQLIFLLLVGLCCVVTNVFFIYATMMMDRAGATVIYDTWPVIAMLLTPLVVRKYWQEIGNRHIALGAVAMLGIALIAFSDQRDDLAAAGGLDLGAMMGTILALMGSLTLALFYAMRIQVSNYLSQHVEELKDKPIAQAFVGEFVSRLAGLPFAVGFLLIFPESGEAPPLEGVLWAAALGFGVLFLGNCTYVIGLLKASSPSLHILWYLVPVLAVAWLWLLGLAQITTFVCIGAGLVVLANILLALDRRGGAGKVMT